MHYRLIAFSVALGFMSLAAAQQPPSTTDKGMAKKDTTKPDTPASGLINGKGPEFYAQEAQNSLDPCIREAAFRTLAVFGPAARKYAGGALLNGLTVDKDATVRVAALQAVQVVGLETDADIEKAIKAVVGMLGSQQIQVRYEAALAIAQVGPKSKKEALTALIQMAEPNAPSWQLRKAAVVALGHIGYDEVTDIPDPLVLHALLKSSRDSAYVVRKEALQSLLLIIKPENASKMKKVDLESARRAMLEHATDKDIGVATWSRVAFLWFDAVNIKANNPQLVALVKQLRDSSPLARYEAYYGLGTIGKYVGIKVKEVMEAVEQETEDYNLGLGVWALGNMGAAGAPALTLLERISQQNKNPAVQQAARDAIAAIQKAKTDAPASTPDKKKN